MTRLGQFFRDEAGAVTVDWVVLTAAIVGMGMMVFLAIRPALSDLVDQLTHEMWHAGQCMAGHGEGYHCH